MNQVWDVVLGTHKVGTAEVKQEGLYYHIYCKCQLPTSEIYTIRITCDGNSRNLGICVPTEEGFAVNTRVPAKHIGAGPFIFQAIPKHAENLERVYPVSPDMEFDHIEQLQNAFFCIQDGKPCVRIKALAPNRQGSGLNPKCQNKSVLR